MGKANDKSGAALNTAEVKKVGDYVKSKYSSFNGQIERVTDDAYIIRSWYNPDTNISVAHQRVPFGETER